MNKSGALGGFRLGRQSQANCGGGNPARIHVEPLLSQFKLLSALQFRLRELYRPADLRLS